MCVGIGVHVYAGIGVHVCRYRCTCIYRYRCTCVYVYMCVGICVHVCAGVGVHVCLPCRSQRSDVFLSRFPHYFLRLSFSLALELSESAGLMGQQFPGTLPTLRFLV